MSQVWTQLTDGSYSTVIDFIGERLYIKRKGTSEQDGWVTYLNFCEFAADLPPQFVVEAQKAAIKALANWLTVGAAYLVAESLEQ